MMVNKYKIAKKLFQKKKELKRDSVYTVAL